MKEERVPWRDREREGCRKGGMKREGGRKGGSEEKGRYGGRGREREGEGGSGEENSETESDADTPLLLDERVVMARRRLS